MSLRPGTAPVTTLRRSVGEHGGMMRMSNLGEAPNRWRWQAQVARMIADAAREIATKRQMLAIADAYERCAEWAEHRSVCTKISNAQS
jgi:hypothetical protein